MRQFVNRHLYNFIVIIILIFFTIFLCMQSELAFFSNGISGTDSSVFRYVARAIHHGQIPYVDTFDHKGPLMYFINYLGLLIHDERGIWVIEVAFIFMAMFFSYLTAQIYVGKILSVFSVITVYSLLGNCYKGGNMTEEYAMTFIAVGIYYFIKYLQCDEIKKYEIIICGCCFSAVCILRINMITIWIAFIPIVLLKNIFTKSWKELQTNIIYFIFGSILVFIPTFIYLILNHALEACWDAYILFNMKYSSYLPLRNRLDCYEFFMNQPLVYLAAGSLLYVCYASMKTREEKKRITVYVLLGTFLALILSFPLMCMSGRKDVTYEMIMIPLLLLPICFFYKMIYATEKKNILMPSSFFIYLCITVWIIIPLLTSSWEKALEKNIYLTTTEEDEWLRDVQAVVNMYCDQDDMISVFGNKDVIYLMCDKESASKYSYQFPIASVDKNIYYEYLDDLEKKPPKIIVIEQFSDRYRDDFKQWLYNHEYQSMNSDESIFIKK